MNENSFKLSVVMITCNAAHCVARSLSSLSHIADEIIVVDSGSQDNTTEMAQKFGAKVIRQPWLGFGPQKQFAVQQASFDWVLCIDADEWLSEELQKSILNVKRHPLYFAYKMPRRNRFLGRFLHHGEAYPDENLRLFHRNYAKWSDDVIHEKIIPVCKVGLLSGDLLHDSAETLHSYLEKQNRYTTLQAQQLVEKGKRISIFKAISSTLFRFIKGYFFRLGFLDGFAGFVHLTIAASNSFFKYTKAIEMQRQKDTEKNS